MIESSSQIIVIAGPNGAGKTTLAPSLLRDWLGLLEYVNADAIAQGLSAFQPEEVAFKAGRVMLGRLRELATKGENFAFETTLATRSYAPWLRELCQQGYRLHISFVWLRSPEMAIQRVRDRVVTGGHDIPEETIRRRYVKGVRNFFALYRPLASSWIVYDNSSLSQPLKLATGEQTVENIIEPALWKEFCEVSK